MITDEDSMRREAPAAESESAEAAICRNNAYGASGRHGNVPTKGGEPPALLSSEVGISIPYSRLQKWVGKIFRRKFESEGYWFSVTDADKLQIDKAGGVAARVILHDSSKVNSPVKGRVVWIRKVKRRSNAWEIKVETSRSPRMIKRSLVFKGWKKRLRSM